MDNLYVFLGATVADAAARPLHWVYDPKKLNRYIKGKKEIAFLKKNRSPFYSVKTGNVSGYNDVGQVMFRTLISSKKKSEILKNFKRNIVKNFGPGSAYWKNLKLRKKYKKIKIYCTLVLTGNNEIRKLNNKFRKKNKTTDVLSFPFYTKDEFKKKIKNDREIYLGDIVVNLNKIKNKDDKNNFIAEFNKLWVHGLLHLFGYDHKKDLDFLKMTKIEKKFISYLN